MNRIIVNCLILFVMICCERSFGQSLSAEMTGMESVWSLSGSFNAKLGKTSKLSFSNTTRISSDYPGEEELHMLMISNFGYSITSGLKSTVGGMYTNSSGFRPSVGIQYMASRKHMLFMLFPNLNISRQSDLMTISLVQVLRGISEKLKFVARMQSLCILNAKGHVFSTLRFRSGFVRGKYQFGAASDFNFFGSDFALAKSYGLFLQYQLF